MEKGKYSLLVFLGGCSYGIISTFVKLAYKDGFSIQEITGLHYCLGAIFLWCAALFVDKIKLSKKQWIFYLFSGIPMGLTGIFYNNSLQYINASFAIILLLQFTWISILLRFLVFKITPNKKDIISIFIILIGTVLASGVVGKNIDFSLYGAFFGLLSATSFSSFLLLSGYNKVHINPIYKSAIMTTGGAIFVLIFMPPVFLFNGALMNGLIKYGVAFALFGSLIPITFLNIGMPKVGTIGNILTASELPTAIIMSMLVLKETVTLVQWAGIICILSGIVYSNYKRQN